MFEKVLILSASVGAGHLRAAQAIEKAFKELNAARQIDNVDTLEYTNKLFQNLYSKAYIELVNKAPHVLGLLYDHFDKPWHNERHRLAFEKLNTRPLIKMIEQYQPDIVVCTHFLPAEIIAELRAKKRLKTRQVITVTDFDAHAMWLCRHCEHYFVALDETKVHLSQLGIPADNITVSGIPIDPVFAQQKSKAKMRQKYGLAPSIPTILVSAGGFGVGPIEHLIRAMVKMNNRVQVVVICGRNEQLKKRVHDFSKDLPRDCPIRILPVGYTTEMDEYMTAADLMLGKPGGLTTSEALAKGLGFIIVNPIPGQEDRNADHLLENGAAIRCNNLPVLAYKIDKLLGDPKRLTAMQANAHTLGRPHSAYEVVKKTLSLL